MHYSLPFLESFIIRCLHKISLVRFLTYFDNCAASCTCVCACVHTLFYLIIEYFKSKLNSICERKCLGNVFIALGFVHGMCAFYVWKVLLIDFLPA